MKKILFPILLSLSLLSVSCNSSAERYREHGKDGENDSVNYISSAKKINVKKVEQLVQNIEKYNAKGKVEEIDYTIVRKLKKISFKPKLTLTKEDLESISKSLQDSPNVRVILDLSRCQMVAEDKVFSDFYGTKSLEEIRLPEGITHLDYSSLSSNHNLKAIYFPKKTTVHSIEHHTGIFNPHLEELHIYNFDGYIPEAFTYCGGTKKYKMNWDDIPNEGISMEMPDHPVYIKDYGHGYYQYGFGNTKVKEVKTPSKTYSFDEWSDMGFDLKPQKGIIKEVSASSELDSQKYSAKNIADSKWTSWVEGSDGDGTGEKITLTLEEPTTIQYLYIKNGFGNLKYYWTNNRPKDISIIFDDDTENPLHKKLNDYPFGYYIPVNKYGKKYSKITIEIESVYKGTDSANDCAIDEITVNSELLNPSDPEHAVNYIYDPETHKIFKGLYALDVGEDDIRVNEQGILEVLFYDWQIDESYWLEAEITTHRELYGGYFPGTGAGGSYSEFSLFLNPNGKHYLFIWDYKSSEIFKIYPANLNIYIWENSTWKIQSEENHATGLNKIFETLKTIEQKELTYTFEAADYTSPNVEITAYPGDGVTNLPTSFKFEYDDEKGIFLPYEKE